MDAMAAFARYEEIRHRLPTAQFPTSSINIENLSDLAGNIDVFLLDAFGVLNVGETCIDGAIERMAELSSLGKKLYVVTNSATFTREETRQKFLRLGYDFADHQIISSRQIALAALKDHLADGLWGVAAPAHAGLSEINARTVRLEDDADVYDQADGFFFLSTSNWTDQQQARLLESIRRRPRPLLIGNPDIVAPREDGLSLEPGFFAHELADKTNCDPIFFGKPFSNMFEEVVATLVSEGIEKQRIAMVGDTLHTDILGGAAVGVRTVLITDHGLLKGQDISALTKSSGIVPDYIAPTT